MRTKKKYLKCFFEGNKINFIVTILGTMATSLFSIFLAIILQKLTDVAISGSMEIFGYLVILSLVFISSLLICEFIVRYFKSKFLRKALVQYRRQAFEDILMKNIDAFSMEKTGSYISVLTNDIGVIENKYLTTMFDIVTYFVYFIGALAVMFYYSAVMTVLVILLSFIPLLVSILSGDKMKALEEELSDKNENFVNMVQDMLHGFTVIKSFNAEPFFLGIYRNSNEQLGICKYKRDMTEKKIAILSETAGYSVHIGIFLVGAYLAIQEKITAGTVIAFVQLMNYVLSPIQSLPQLFLLRKAADNLIDKMTQLVRENVSEGGTIEHKQIEKNLCLENVSFSYEENNFVLKDINVQFEKGKSYAIVGMSGSGKTTLLNLLSGGLNKYSGNIMLDGINIKEVRKKDIYNIFSLIEQKVYVFDDTINNNISLHTDIAKSNINEIIRKSNLEKLVEEKGDDYKCGENGNKLSGGEKQRISIARSLLKNASVFLVDEATSALDNQNATAITEEILGISNATKIVVTHKLNEYLLKKFDSILVLRDGTIEETGTFEELMSKKKYFYSMYTINQ